MSRLRGAHHILSANRSRRTVAVARFDGKQLTALDWIGTLAGVLAVLVSFLSWRHVRGTGLVDLARAVGFRTWYTAWSSGITAWLPVLLLAFAAMLILARGFGI